MFRLPVLPARAKEGRKLGLGQGIQEELGMGREGERGKDRERWRAEKEAHTIQRT